VGERELRSKDRGAFRAIRGRRNRWRLLLLPVDVAAVLFAARSFKLAADYVAAERRAV